MTQNYIVKSEAEKNPLLRKSKIVRHLKFYLIPGWRDPEFAATEYEIGKIKSKRRFFRRLLTPLTIIGVVIFLFFIFWAVYAPWLSQYTLHDLSKPYIPPDQTAFSPPSPEHPLGTTKYGYDLLGRLIWGARFVYFAAIFPVIISISAGIVLGSIAAYFGGVVDSILMRICDIMYSFPMLILVIVLTPILGRDLFTILAIFAILYIPYSLRFVRSLILQVKQNIYIKAAITGGANKFKVMFKHIVPNAMSPILISIFGSMGSTILGIVGIAFLGLFDESNLINWGTDLMYARASLSAYWVVFWPGFVIALAAIGFMLLGDGLRDAFDPRSHI